MTNIRLKIRKIIRTVFYYVILVFIALVLAVVMRVFFFASFSIPSPSMEPSVLAGDQIIVSKLIPGPRVYKNFNFRDGGKVETCRFKGSRAIRRNDVLVFNYPYTNWSKLEMDLSVNYLKRCVAIPGDTFYIDNGIYKVKGSDDILGNYRAQSVFSQTREEDIRPEIFNCFPGDTVYNWNVKNFGPLYVPRKGDTLQIDSKNILLYRKLIRYETDKEIETRNDMVFLDDKPLLSYVFQQNYYFMSGDLVQDSKDSRYWGLLPEDHIIGKAAIVWKSKDRRTGKTGGRES
jgi:signal peptidase I, bacterial type